MGGFVLILIFSVIFFCSLIALQSSPFCKMRFPLAVCVSLLSVIRLANDFGGSPENRHSLIDIILIPSEALTLALLTIVLIWLLSAIRKWGHRFLGDQRCKRDKFKYIRSEEKQRKRSPICKRESET